jgi:hypothetical protein
LKKICPKFRQEIFLILAKNLEVVSLLGRLTDKVVVQKNPVNSTKEVKWKNCFCSKVLVTKYQPNLFTK